MQLKTILNRVERYKSFVYGEPRWADEACSTIEVPIRARANGRPICSGCGKRRPGYDRLQPRRFEFVPLWQIAAGRVVQCAFPDVDHDCEHDVFRDVFAMWAAGRLTPVDDWPEE